LLSTLARYVGDLPGPDEFEAAMAQSLSPEAQTVLDARIALRRGVQSLRHAMNSMGDVLITAERLRHAARRFAPRSRWSPIATSATWRKNALASAVTGHASELILWTLAERANQLAADPATCTKLHKAADAISQAWPEWRAITHHWDILSTGIHRGTGTSHKGLFSAPVRAIFKALAVPKDVRS
jgi:hypothetical protein